jgi:hypothetical protein
MSRQGDFEDELFALLRKYRVEMEVRERYHGYGYDIEGIGFYSPALYDDSGTKVEEEFDFRVGKWEDGNPYKG